MRITRREAQTIAIKIALGFATATPSFSAKEHEYQTGKLVDITSDERLEDGTTFRWTLITVQVNDIVYTARGGRLRRHSGDPGHGLVVGDAVKVAVDGNELFLVKPDGKELKAKITKRARTR